jgi:hypothetical protein
MHALNFYLLLVLLLKSSEVNGGYFYLCLLQKIKNTVHLHYEAACNSGIRGRNTKPNFHHLKQEAKYIRMSVRRISILLDGKEVI